MDGGREAVVVFQVDLFSSTLGEETTQTGVVLLRGPNSWRQRLCGCAMHCHMLNQTLSYS